jgi:nucleoside-diphosphate-sugar epimerase
VSLISSDLSNEKRVLVTGASGFIGRTVTTLLQTKSINVIGASSRSDPKSDLFYIDYQNLNAVELAISEIAPTHIIHLAGTNLKRTQKSEWKISADSDFRMNSNLFIAASRSKNLPQVIYLGSCEEYGVLKSPFAEHDSCRPITAYGDSKHKSTNLLMEIANQVGMNSIVLRPSVVYGIGQQNGMLISNLVENLLTQTTFRILNPKQIRDFIHVDDVARAILMALESDIPYKEPILNIASGMSISVEEVVQKVLNVLGVNLSKFVIFEPEEDGQNNAEYYSVENKLAFKSLGWKPNVNFEVGLAQYIEWSSKEMTRFSQS